MERQSQNDAGRTVSQQQGQNQPAQTEQMQPAPRRAQPQPQAGGSDDNSRQMTGTQFRDWASI